MVSHSTVQSTQSTLRGAKDCPIYDVIHSSYRDPAVVEKWRHSNIRYWGERLTGKNRMGLLFGARNHANCFDMKWYKGFKFMKEVKARIEGWCYLKAYFRGGELIYYHGLRECCIIAGGPQNQFYPKIMPLSQYEDSSSIFFQNRKKCWSRILPNTLKFPKKLFLVGCTLWGASNPPTLFRGGKIASMS